MRTMQTTVKSRSPLLNVPTEIQTATNAFAIAVRNNIQNPTPENQKALEEAQAELYRVEDIYREGRKLRLAFALEHKQGPQL